MTTQIKLPKAVRAMAQEIARAVDRKSPGTVLQAEDAALDMAHLLMEPVCRKTGLPEMECSCSELLSRTNTVTRAEYEHRKQLLDRKVSGG